MGDSSRQKNSPWTSSRSSNNNSNITSAQNPWGFSPQANLEALIAASPSLVTSVKDARSWLEGKGWLLTSKENSKLKLTDILLLAALSFKLLAEASTAIYLVAFLLRDHADKALATTVSDTIIEKMIDKLSDPLGTLNDFITTAKDFLDATAQKHASELLVLQNTVKQHADFNQITCRNIH